MTTIDGVFFDFGGVILTSPFDAFADYEREAGLPADFIRTLNATNPDTNAWAKLERGAVGFDEFCELFEAEARAAGHTIDARRMAGLLRGQLRPEMVEALRRIHGRLVTAMLTNNFALDDEEGASHGVTESPMAEVVDLFDHIVESRLAGVRKPDPAFYELALEVTGLDPHRVVFLDDLGINLKPARAMGMTTIKVVDPAEALRELEAVVGFPLGQASADQS